MQTSGCSGLAIPLDGLAVTHGPSATGVPWRDRKCPEYIAAFRAGSGDVGVLKSNLYWWSGDKVNHPVGFLAPVVCSIKL